MQKFFPWSLRKVIEKVGGESLNISDDLLAFRQRMSSSQRISPHFVLGENCSPVCICYKLLPQLNFLTFQFYSLGFLLEVFLSNTSTSCAFYDLLLSAENWPQKFFECTSLHSVTGENARCAQLTVFENHQKWLRCKLQCLLLALKLHIVEI